MTVCCITHSLCVYTHNCVRYPFVNKAGKPAQAAEPRSRQFNKFATGEVSCRPRYIHCLFCFFHTHTHACCGGKVQYRRKPSGINQNNRRFRELWLRQGGIYADRFLSCFRHGNGGGLGLEVVGAVVVHGRVAIVKNSSANR